MHLLKPLDAVDMLTDYSVVNQIIADFAPDAGKAGFNWVNAVAAGFFFGSGASGLAGEATAPATAALAFVGEFAT